MRLPCACMAHAALPTVSTDRRLLGFVLSQNTSFSAAQMTSTLAHYDANIASITGPCMHHEGSDDQAACRHNRKLVPCGKTGIESSFQNSNTSGGLRGLHERDVVTLQQYPTFSRGTVSVSSQGCMIDLKNQTPAQLAVCAAHQAHLPRGFLVFLFMETSSASSSTRFMYSSKPCAAGSQVE